ncbi:MAG: AI-2E family transporter [Bdellovibrionales bacterium]
MQQQITHWTPRKTQLVLLTIVGLYLILFLPFWKPVLLGFLFAAACAPLVNRVRVRMNARRTRIAYATVTLGLVLLIGLSGVVALQIYSQLYDIFQSQESVASFSEKISGFRDQLLAWTSRQEYLSSFNVKAQFDRAVVGVTNSAKGLLLTGARTFVASAPTILLQMFIFFIAYSAFLVSLPRLWIGLCRLLNLEGSSAEHFRKFEFICSLSLGSVLITGLLQSILVFGGAALAGYSGLILIFSVAFICSLIPVVGAGSVAFVLFLAGLFRGETSVALIMLATTIVVGISDNVFRAWLFSRAAKSNPAISIITLLGGIALMGFPGLFVAPVLEQLVMTYVFGVDESAPEAGLGRSTVGPVRQTPQPV